jgi:acyl-CoA synthetase (AMP-forming)/AMP-acid ligase II
LCRNGPDAPVLLMPDGIVTRTDLGALSDAYAARLPPERAVALVAENGPAFLAGLLAILDAGGAALLIDPTTPLAAQRRIASRLGARAILRPEAGGAAAIEPLPPVTPPFPTPPGTILKLTSGSTGEPRAVLAGEAAIASDAERLAATMRIGPDDRLVAAVPMSFSYGLSSLAAPALLLGIPLVVPRPGSPFNLLIAAERARATVLPTTPAFLQALLAATDARLARSLRLVLSAGAPLRQDVARRFRERFARGVHAFYGASECGGICYDRTGHAAEQGTVGTPVDGVAVRVDPEGRVLVRSPSVARGCWPGADERLAGGEFRSDDLGQFCGGELRLLGRVGDGVIVAGRKAHPREIELVLHELAGVDDAAVAAEPDPRRGARWRAFVAGACGRPTAAAVLAHCRERLAPHLVPDAVVLLDKLPRNARGKVDWARLAAAAGRS